MSRRWGRRAEATGSGAPDALRERVKPICCPFCEVAVARPTPFAGQTSAAGGWCACGALFVADETGRAGGEAMLGGLTLLCAGDVEAAMRLRGGADYEMKEVGWLPRSHSEVAPRPGRGRNFGQAKIWFFRRR
jgi:hypothetical protein